MDEEKSLFDYTEEVWQMLVQLCYTDDGNPVTFDDDIIHDNLWTTLDLWFSYIAMMIEGRCSLAKSIKFDLHSEIMSKHKEITDIYNQLSTKK